MKWKPREGQKYYYLSTHWGGFFVEVSRYEEFVDYADVEDGNCFRTKKSAEEARRKIIKILGGK